MKTRIRHYFYSAQFRKLPSLLLAALLHIVPLAKSVCTNPALATSPFVIIARLAVGAFAYLGYDSIAGATSINSPTTARATNGVPFTYRITTTSTYADMEYTSSSFPSAIANLNHSPYPNSTISGTPNSTAGTYTCTITVSASGYPTISQNVSLTLVNNYPATAPTNVVVQAKSTSQLLVTWSPVAFATGYKVMESQSPLGPYNVYSQPTVTNTTFTGNPSTTYYFEVQATSSVSNSPVSTIVSGTTSNTAPVLNPISSQTVNVQTPVNFTATASDIGENCVADFGNFSSYANGALSTMFQAPSYSSATSPFLDGSANVSMLTNVFPAGHTATNVLRANWGWASGPNGPWLRLTTSATAVLANPIIDFNRILRFDIYTTADVQVGLGVRESSPSKVVGMNGGTTGVIDWVGVNGTNANALGAATPAPVRTVTANSWQTLQFNIPTEPVTAYTGTGVLQSTTGKGVLEHLAFVPAAGPGPYVVYLDNFSVVYTNILTFSLGPSAPSGASIDPQAGAFSWTPSANQTGQFSIPVIVTDNGVPPMSATQMVQVTVNASINGPPSLTPISDQYLEAGSTLTITNSATQTNVPTQTLTYSLDTAPAGAAIDPSSGIFTWTPDPSSTNSTNSVTVRCTGNGSPPMSATQSFNIFVVSRALATTGFDDFGNMTVSWNTIAGNTYIVMYKDALTDPVWLPLSTNVADGSTLMITDPASTSTNRFYLIFESQ